MSEEVNEETYSVIYSALKHPIRRKILRMLSKEDLTYTQMLISLDVDTGHLNYYLESLEELLSKTQEGKYRLSEVGKSATKLMHSVEENEHHRVETYKLKISKRRIVFLIQLITIIALIVAALGFVNVKYETEYWHMSTLWNREAVFAAPSTPVNVSARNIDHITYNFAENTLSNQVQAFYKVDVVTNATIWVQVKMGTSESTIMNEINPDLLLYNETLFGPFYSEQGTTLKHEIFVPLSQEKLGDTYGLPGWTLEVSVANLGKTAERYEIELNHEAIIKIDTYYPYIKQTEYPYFYYGITLIIVAVVIAILPYVVTRSTRINSKSQLCVTQQL
jgi:DNA-binding transcriptional ArsR family regulator